MRRRGQFDPSFLYMHKESGCIACGAHVGTEATYAPDAWEKIGRGPSVLLDGAVVAICEIPHRKPRPDVEILTAISAIEQAIAALDDPWNRAKDDVVVTSLETALTAMHEARRRANGEK